MKRAILLLSLVSLTGATTAASTRANPLQNYTLTGPGYSDVTTISGNAGGNYIDGYAGRYQGQLGSNNINVFCVDLNHDINFGQGFTANTDYSITDASGPSNGTYYQGGLSSALDSGDYGAVTGTGLSNSQRASEVGFLIESYANASANTFMTGASGSQDMTANLAAISLSIWDISGDGGDGLSNGTVVAGSATQTKYNSLVSFYENMATAHKMDKYLNVRWIQAPINGGAHYQTFAYVEPVPEASTGILFAFLLVAGGMTLRLQRKKAAVR